MNIAEAKQQLKNALTAYFTKDQYGNYKIPPEAQRPVFLMGPPGIGKTAIVKQVAEEMGVGLVSYSITHHTRQSALGLPMIVEKEYCGQSYHVSEYTMSEIIAAVYEVIESSGAKEGILFLDEINCASETLTPVMLQFLQFKTFGKHSVPDGWIIVTAGNPPEFNRSAREFDIVTWDRLKRVDIEPDYSAWKDYAMKKGVHGAVLSYLDIKKENFYKLETTPEGVNFVTARGWINLSEMIYLYEENSIAVDEKLVAQYLQNPEIAADFAAYYELYNKYKSDYRVEDILCGKPVGDIIIRAKDADFDERLSLIGLLLSALNAGFRKVIDREDLLSELLPILKDVKAGAALSDKLAEEKRKEEQTQKRGIMTAEAKQRFSAVIDFLEKANSNQADFAQLKESYGALLSEMGNDAKSVSDRLSAMFKFIKDAFDEGQELLIVVTELTANWYSARFISRYGSEDYYASSDKLAFYQRGIALAEELENTDAFIV